MPTDLLGGCITLGARGRKCHGRGSSLLGASVILNTRVRPDGQFGSRYMFGNNATRAGSLRELFGWGDKTQPQASASQPRPPSNANTSLIICFRIDQDLNRRISRALHDSHYTRSEFIRAAIERFLKQDAEERLRAAHSAIRWE